MTSSEWNFLLWGWLIGFWCRPVGAHLWKKFNEWLDAKANIS